METVLTYTELTGVTAQVAGVAGDNWARIARIPVVRSTRARSAGAFAYKRIIATGERRNERVRLNAALKPDDLRAVLLHELAHIVHTYECGRSDHGPIWASYARALGCPAEACATRLEGSEYLNANARYQYRCQDCGAIVAKFRRPKWDRGEGSPVDRFHTKCHRARTANRGRLVRMAVEEIEQAWNNQDDNQGA
jgi:predicted SprT family Zn-dependent metalloprotease